MRSLAFAAVAIAPLRAWGADAAWPPSTAPRVDLPREPEPAPAPVAPSKSAAPVAPAPPPVAPEPPAAPAPPPVVTPASETPTLVREPAREELWPSARYGSQGGQLYARTAHDEVMLLPTARLELDGQSVSPAYTGASGTTSSLGLARVDAAGWIVLKVYFDLSAEFAHGPSARHTDEILAVASWGRRAILQLGQFDAPFTLENRTPDRYLDLVHRGAAIRAFAIPENKDQGVMVHGLDPDEHFYYSAALLNGEGPAVTGVNGSFDVMARGWVAPFSFRDPDILRDVHVGASLWTGDRSNGQPLDQQSTQGGYDILDPTAWWMAGGATAPRIQEHGRLAAVALELDAPFANRWGVRFEWIGKRQPYAVLDRNDPAHPKVAATLNQSGFSAYAEVWGWVLGDNGLLGFPAAPGLNLPAKLGDFRPEARPYGVMVVGRVDYIDETMSLSNDASAGTLGIASQGDTKLTAYTLGVTGWYTRRARLTLNYVFNHIDGSTPFVYGLQDHDEQELMLLTALAL